MNIDAVGISFIKGFEGLLLKAYQDKAGVWTIGWGSTRYADGKPVKKGDVLLTRECADDLFIHTLATYVSAVNHAVKVPLTQSQFNALVDFEYNAGAGALAESTLLIKLNAKNYAGAADEFLKWDKITDPKTGNKVPLPDLTARRRKERLLFLQNVAA